MSRPEDTAAQSAAVPNAEPAAVDLAPPFDPARSRRRFLAAGALLALWLLALALVALATANPATLNRLQIKQAQYVVTATIVDRAAGRVRMTRFWKGRALDRPDELTIENLADAGVLNGAEYLIPLSKRSDGRLVVTETRLPNGRPLAYPATPEAMAEIEALVKEK